MNSTHLPHPRMVRYAERACGHDPIQRVLAVVDLKAVSHPAVEKAAMLATAFGATLELYTCDEGESVPGSWAGGSTLAQYQSVVRERGLAGLQELAATHGRDGLSVSTVYECHANTEEALVTHAIRTGVSLVVKDVGRQGRAGLASNISDPTLISHLPMPLLLVRAAAWGPHPRIATSIDPCRRSERSVELDESIVGIGASVSRALAGVSFAIHVLEGLAHLPGDVVTEGARRVAFDKQREQVLALGCLGSLDDREVHFAKERVPEGIVQLAEETQPSILVMGVAARPHADTPGGGTVCEVLRRTACDLLVAKAAGFVSPLMVAE